MRKIWILVLGLIIVLIFINHFRSYKKQQDIVIGNIYSLAFNGEVETILVNRGFKVRLKKVDKFFNLSGTCNDTACLAQNITWGDSLSKQPNSNVIILKSKVTGKLSKWILPNSNSHSDVSM